MNTKQILDPLSMWRETIDRLEGGVNSFTARNMESEQFSQALALVLRASLGSHHVFDKNMARVYERLGLPSRSEVEAIAAGLRRIEDKLDMLLPPLTPVHRPARTKVAPKALAESAQSSQPPAAAKTKADAVVAPTPKRKG